MKPLRNEDYEALAGFRYGMRKFLRFSKDELRRHGQLTPEQYEAMLALRAFGTARGLTVGQLSERLQVKHHTAVTLVNKLVERGAAMFGPHHPKERRARGHPWALVRAWAADIRR